jgi:hypothetical protein
MFYCSERHVVRGGMHECVAAWRARTATPSQMLGHLADGRVGSGGWPGEPSAADTSSRRRSRVARRHRRTAAKDEPAKQRNEQHCERVESA